MSLAQPIQHHSCGEKHSRWVRDATPGYVWSRTMTRLEDGMLVANVCGRRHPHAANERRTHIREDVSEHVLSDDHVEFPRRANQS
jgi:hypothetical protein